MRKIAITNRKGGVGKTTTAVHIAHALALAGRTVLLIDTDTQSHCSMMLGVDPEHGLAELMDDKASAADVLCPARKNLFLLAGGKQLAGVSRIIARQDFDAQYTFANSLKPYEDRYDFVIIDTPPAYSVLSVNVLFYAEELLIPVSMEVLAVSGFIDFLGELKPIQERSGVNIAYVVPTIADYRVKKTSEILEDLKNNMPTLVTEPIRYSAAMSTLPRSGKTMFERDDKNRAAVDYAKLVRRILNGQG